MCGRLLQALLYYCRLYFYYCRLYIVGVLCACLEHEEGGSGADIHRYVHTDIHISVYTQIYIIPEAGRASTTDARAGLLYWHAICPS